jgi:hypothetical protein
MQAGCVKAVQLPHVLYLTIFRVLLLLLLLLLVLLLPPLFVLLLLVLLLLLLFCCPQKLMDLATAAELKGKIEAMFKGEHINSTEDRAVLHVATRARREQVRQGSSGLRSEQ